MTGSQNQSRPTVEEVAEVVNEHHWPYPKNDDGSWTCACGETSPVCGPLTMGGADEADIWMNMHIATAVLALFAPRG